MHSFEAANTLLAPASQYLEYLASERQLAKSSVLNYRSDLNNFVSFIADYRLLSWHKLSKRQVYAFLHSEQMQGKPIASLKRLLCCVRGFLQFLMAKKYLAQELLIQFEFVLPVSTKKTLAPAIDIQKLLGFCANDFISIRDKALLLLLVHTDLTLGEISALNFYALDFSRGQIISVTRQGAEQSKCLNDQTTTAVTQWFEHRQSVSGVSDRLFVSILGKSLSVRALQLRLTYWGNIAGIKGFSLRALRRPATRTQQTLNTDLNDTDHSALAQISHRSEKADKKSQREQLLFQLYFKIHPRAKHYD